MEFFHVLNRGLNKQDVFVEDGDRLRFVQSLFVFNDSMPVPNGITQRKLWNDRTRKRDCLVNIHAWCLMSNHYHLLISPVKDDLTKLSLFMKKLNGGYAKFFNEKYNRSGYLWQGKYKKIHIETGGHLDYIPYYIHMNPLDFQFKDWREGKLSQVQKALQHLDSYRWSSWQDYTGHKNFPSILHRSYLSEFLGSKNNQTDTVKKIAKDEMLASNSSVLET